MCRITSKPCEGTNASHCALPNVSEPPSSLLFLCNRVVTWFENFETPGNPINQAEAAGGSDADLEAAMAQEIEVLLEIDQLASRLAEMHATSQPEIEGKQRALNALTSNQSWERDSLYNLRISIERDQAEVYAGLLASSSSKTQHMGWLGGHAPAAAADKE